jgi:hypothetical protein
MPVISDCQAHQGSENGEGRRQPRPESGFVRASEARTARLIVPVVRHVPLRSQLTNGIAKKIADRAECSEGHVIGPTKRHLKIHRELQRTKSTADQGRKQLVGMLTVVGLGPRIRTHWVHKRCNAASSLGRADLSPVPRKRPTDVEGQERSFGEFLLDGFKDRSGAWKNWRE